MPELSATQQIQSLYISLLNRPADPEGLAYWANELMVKQAPSSVIEAILNSQEYAQKELQPSPPQLIDSVYLNLFGRPPDEGGRKYYLEKMQNQKKEEVIKEIIENATGVDAANKQQKVETAEKMSQQLQEQQQQLQFEQIQNQIKALQEAMQRMQELLQQTNEKNQPTLDNIKDVVKEANETIKPEPIIITVPGPTEYVEVPGSVAISLGDTVDTLAVGEGKVDLIVAVNSSWPTLSSDLTEANLDQVEGFGADDHISLGAAAADTLIIFPDEASNFAEALSWASGATGPDEITAYVFVEEQGSADSWLFLSSAGVIENGVQLVGGPADFTESNILTFA
ncbi:DUF4214 domain-containing protein [Devosia sp. RR2S18]|uniref:DUF4214 domain-containing protein n=1 Tax=Devosia rhizosphaerae TaxID=3049774 RepID=UPI00253FC8C6|nr:DUF4214 domain-containing protein [Devosia sp. RR2S18]WIJ26569.1 DUF4214 domain-containing protein [Devosia sp. RR2S18]